jgi:2-keto-4-pentenoate hydratase/2-oxohepta-3-ene-1,7-dioic acid hydratase in catechol pathway
MKVIRYRGLGGEVALAQVDAQGDAWALDGDLFEGLEPTGRKVNPVALLTPLDPLAIIGIALNYRRHVEETGREIPLWPVLFMKLPWVAQAHQAPIVLPGGAAKSTKVDYEGELAVVIGRECRDVPPERALDHVLGYTCANDVSARDWQFEWSGGQLCRAKTFDTFCPLGPCLVTADAIPDPATLRLRTQLNGVTVQDTPLSDLIFDVPALIAFLSAGTTLLPGTVILTGTPGGVGHASTPPRYLRPGDSVAVDIDAIGTLVNPVAAATAG